MSNDALSTYLNDHLAGATHGSDHAKQLVQMTRDTPFGVVMARLADEIEQDRETLIDLMERLDITRNPVKQAGAWVVEKAGRVKFSGLSATDEDLGLYLALEAMSLGVEGKHALWTALRRVQDDYPELQRTDLEGLIARATTQREMLEAERLVQAERAFRVRAAAPSG